MNVIDFIDESGLISTEDLARLEKIIDYTLKQEGINFNYEISVSFVTDDVIKELNKTYRNIDSVTDVLSFPLIEDFNVDFIGDIQALGDIVISVEQAKKQANEYNHSFKREIAFLVVHSVLHLIGYTHETKTEETEMFSIQEQVLKVFEIER